MRDSPEIRRRLRDLYELCLDTRKFVVIVSPVKLIPEELERAIVYLELAVPDLPELVELPPPRGGGGHGRRRHGRRERRDAQQLARALQGLTLDDAATRSAARSRRGTRSTRSRVPLLLEEKRLLVNRTGMIEYIPTVSGIENIGGLEIMKKWLLERRKLFQMRDELSAEIVPKGVLVMGISGCGKSLSDQGDRVVLRAAALPHRHDRDLLRPATASPKRPSRAPATCSSRWRRRSSGSTRSRPASARQAKEGELGRIFAFFLTWMQEKARGLFVGATANRIDLLPAEMIRKGRFDEVFFVDLPLDDERLEIFRVHLRRRGIDPRRSTSSR